MPEPPTEEPAEDDRDEGDGTPRDADQTDEDSHPDGEKAYTPLELSGSEEEEVSGGLA